MQVRLLFKVEKSPAIVAPPFRDIALTVQLPGYNQINEKTP